VKLLEKLGPVLHQFNRACNALYLQSVEGKQPAWIAALFDAGKPAHLIEAARDKRVKTALPSVIRPDLLLTEEGFGLAELDSIPGGIGLTAWLNETYTALGSDVIGGATGMRDGFGWILDNAPVVISKEAADYRPEMEWLLGADRVKEAETFTSDGTRFYRFFECFDWPNLGEVGRTWNAGHPVTPPVKPHLEEKLWLALFWLRPLRDYWRQQLGDKSVQLLQQIIPYGWMVDPTPLPPHAVIPELGIQDWKEAETFSQKQRELVLKISGFSPQAWGSRGVTVGSDVPGTEWAEAVRTALTEFSTQPRILQKFTKSALVEQDYVDAFGTLQRMRGRARVCPYYFARGEEVRLGGVLVTLVPADKKLIHGMSEAVLSPARAAV
jgi:hypothetical protein